MKEFSFIFVFGYFSLYYEIFAKFTEIDGTGNLNTDYHPLKANDDETTFSPTKLNTNFNEAEGTVLQTKTNLGNTP